MSLSRVKWLEYFVPEAEEFIYYTSDDNIETLKFAQQEIFEAIQSSIIYDGKDIFSYNTEIEDPLRHMNEDQVQKEVFRMTQNSFERNDAALRQIFSPMETLVATINLGLQTCSCQKDKG
ncbi:hypothetical protein JCM33374_g2059 [Metschnikowia sp. JCM 33374]|nr:hypothetical protein JCM33374_g2059 [Metschnikowia sp. JCM 33374]